MFDFEACKQHVLGKVAATPVAEAPYYHMYIEGILPDDLYAFVKGYALQIKKSGAFQERRQDSALYVNRRYNLVADKNLQIVHRIFSDTDVRNAFLNKFYVNKDFAEERQVVVHKKEFEFVYTENGRFQNIHTDIPAKYLSFVFYLPQDVMTDEQEAENATVLYNRDLEPVYGARYKDNSVCIFAPHFYSYHGFSTTVDRISLVLFYLSEETLVNNRRSLNGSSPEKLIETFKDNVQRKLEKDPLIEYQSDEAKMQKERRLCRINAPQGRVMV